MGGDVTATGNSSAAFNADTKATGRNSVAFNQATEAKGVGSATFGFRTVANGINSVAMGQNTKALGDGSFVMGDRNEARAKVSTAFGTGNIAEGNSSFVLGIKGKAVGISSFVTGADNIAEGRYSISNGRKTIAKGDQSVANGYGTIADGRNSYVIGLFSEAIGSESFAGCGLSKESTEIMKDILKTKNYSKYRELLKEDVAKVEKILSMPNNDERRGLVFEVLKTITKAKGHLGGQALGDDSFAFGMSSVAKLDSSVALGSYANANTEKGQVGYLSTLKEDEVNNTLPNFESSTWKSTLNAMAVGDETIDKTRQITGLAAGTVDTDAVNVAQLRLLKAYTDKMNELVLNNSNQLTFGNGEKIEFGDSFELSEDPGENKITVNLKKNNESSRKKLQESKVEIPSQLTNKEKEKLDVAYRATGAAANATAMANIPQVSGDKLFSIGFGAGYVVNRAGGFALGFSGQDKDKTVVYKVTGALDTQLGVNLGAGINYNFGKIKTNINKSVNENTPKMSDDKLEDVLKTLKDLKGDVEKLKGENKDLNDNVTQLEDKNKELERKLDEKVKEVKNSKMYKVIIRNFDLDKFKVKSEHLKNLKKAVDLANENMVKEINIYGFTDTAHTERYNLALGLKRAKAAHDMMKKLGLNPSIKVNRKSRGYNEVTGYKPSSLRRVEIIINPTMIEIE